MRVDINHDWVPGDYDGPNVNTAVGIQIGPSVTTPITMSDAWHLAREFIAAHPEALNEIAERNPRLRLVYPEAEVIDARIVCAEGTFDMSIEDFRGWLAG